MKYMKQCYHPNNISFTRPIKLLHSTFPSNKSPFLNKNHITKIKKRRKASLNPFENDITKIKDNDILKTSDKDVIDLENNGKITLNEEEDIKTTIPPRPGLYQQTLWRSFCVNGLGLHSGELACVRVRPAFAGTFKYS